MPLPSINQYVDTLDAPFGLFKTIGKVEASRDTYGKVKSCAGNSAVIFRVLVNSEARLLKCHIKPVAQMERKHEYIANLAERFAYLTNAKVVSDEIYVYDSDNNGRFYDVVVADWVEGESLGAAIDWAVRADDRRTLRDLADKFDHLALSILRQEWAHGDLKPDNIIVDHRGSLHLIDYNAVFIPEFAGQKSAEIGTQPYQHPLRGIGMYDRHIDDYSIALISVSLHATAHDPAIYKQYHRGDNIIFDARDAVAVNCEPLLRAMELWSHVGESNLYKLAQMVGSPTPYLYELEPALAAIVDCQPSTANRK